MANSIVISKTYDTQFPVSTSSPGGCTLLMHDRIIQSYVKVVLEDALAKNGFKIKVNIEEDALLQRRITDLNIVARKII